MLKIPLADIKAKIVESGKLSGIELDSKIKEKINELSGLISEEGAAHIIANELGVKLVSTQAQTLKIKEMYSGMRGVGFVGKVTRKFEVREFNTNNRQGKVCSLVIGDETATTRLVFWNDQVDQLVDVKEGDVLRVNGAYVRDNRGSKEVHLGDKGEIEINPEGVVIEGVRQGGTFQRKKIEELTDGAEGAEIMGTIVQVFDPRFFHVCSTCNKRAMESGEGFSCQEHGTVEANLNYVMNAVVDDGSGNIRGVFWKNQTNNLLGLKEEEMTAFNENMEGFEELKTDLLGEQIKLAGKVRRNEMFDRLEFNVALVQRAQPAEEIKRLEETKAEAPTVEAPVEQKPTPENVELTPASDLDSSEVVE